MQSGVLWANVSVGNGLGGFRPLHIAVDKQGCGRMLIQRSSIDVVVRAPAKLNLFFEVLAKRNDGYHEIETLVCPIDLYDTLYFRKELGGQVNLQCDRVPESGRCNGRASDD